jgi:tetratricopeptide (TPR) repeat protein
MLHASMHGPSRASSPNISRLLRRASRAHGDGDADQAERLYNAVLQYSPENFDALHGLGKLHCQRGRLDTALVLIQAALRFDCDRADGFASLGLVFHLLHRFAEALASYDAGLDIAPDDAELLNRRGVALLELRRPHEALQDFESALIADPHHLDALGNYGNALLKLNRPAEAIAAYDRALTIAPQNAQLLTNRAVALRRLDRPHEALMSASRALVSRPDFAQARFVEAVTRLTLGDFSGWRGYEARWSVGLLASQRRSFTAPLWQGRETLEGKTILLHAEQGFGDTIHFVRYARLVAARGVKIILEVQRELVRLLSGMNGADTVIARGEALPPFDFHCPLLSLPLALATEPATIPAEIPYIAPADEEVCLWRERMPRDRPRIGLVWSGDRSHDNDFNRSLRLETLLPLLDRPDISFVSLQHIVRDEDAPVLRKQPNICRIEFRDFADTAAAVAALDAVIAVDTAVAHLAGAMGKPLFLLLPYAADFRWLRERSDSPWYPTARLYRQHEFGNWEGAVEALSQDLTRASLFPAAQKLSA